MIKKIFLFGVVLLMAGRLFAAEEPCLITVKADNTETAYALTTVQRIVFENNTMTVVMKDAPDVTGIVCLRFDVIELNSIDGVKSKKIVFLFPNPVKTMLTITGTEKNSKVDLYDLTGKLIKSIPAQDNATNIDVSSLQQGVYLLRVGTQTIKFVKQ